jgi:hypothetical protein
VKNKLFLTCLLTLGAQTNSFGMEFAHCDIVSPATYYDSGGDNIIFKGPGYYKNTRSTFIMSDDHRSYKELLTGKRKVGEYSYENVEYKVYEELVFIGSRGLRMAAIVMKINNKFIYFHNAKIKDIQSIFNSCAEIDLNLILKKYNKIYDKHLK